MKEVAWQSKIIKRLRSEGAYARKWATQYAVGVPDLIIVGMAGMNFLQVSASMFVEVKIEKNWGINTRRTINLSKKQIVEIAAIHKAGGIVRVMVVLEHAPNDATVRLVSGADVAKALASKEGVVLSRDEMMLGHKYNDIPNLYNYIAGGGL